MRHAQRRSFAPFHHTLLAAEANNEHERPHLRYLLDLETMRDHMDVESDSAHTFRRQNVSRIAMMRYTIFFSLEKRSKEIRQMNDSLLPMC